LDFDFACTARLQIYDAEREQRQFEAMSGGLLLNALQGNVAPTSRKPMKEGSF
jgi:hypothetical protein